MVKKKSIALCLLLFGCSNKRVIYCEKNINDEKVSLQIFSTNNVIESIVIDKELKLPYSFVNDKEKLSAFLNSINKEYTLNGNTLYYSYEEKLDKKYNLVLTLDELAKECFYCG